MIPRATLRTVVAVALMASPQACRAPGEAGGLAQPLAGREWSLTELSGEPVGPGAGGKSATILFSSNDHRAGGFGGCNRYGASYSVASDSLSFGPVAVFTAS